MLNETKYTDLNNLKKHKSIKDVQRSAHSQGYDVSEPKQSVGDHYTVDMTHRKTGQKVAPRLGGKLGGSHSSKKGGVDSTLVNQIAGTIKADAASRGRVDKTSKAKAKRKADAKANKERKARDRDPFTRQKTFEEFMLDCVAE